MLSCVVNMIRRCRMRHEKESGWRNGKQSNKIIDVNKLHTFGNENPNGGLMLTGRGLMQTARDQKDSETPYAKQRPEFLASDSDGLYRQESLQKARRNADINLLLRNGAMR